MKQKKASRHTIYTKQRAIEILCGWFGSGRTGRKLDVHGLRTTYRSMTEGWLSRAFLLDAMGHRSADVHDGYLQFLERQVEAAGRNAPEVEAAWNLGEK